MTPSIQHTLEQLKEIVQDKVNVDQGTCKVQEQLDASVVVNRDNSSSVLRTVLRTIKNESEYNYLDNAVRLPNSYPICTFLDDQFPANKYSIPGLSGTKFLAYQVWAIRLIVSR
jgi:hypothetical protein